MKRALTKGIPLTYLWKAINHYGVDCWDKEELFSGIANAMDDIAREERRFIESERTMVPNGYNLTEGGEGRVGAVASTETREKLRRFRLGMKASDETKKKMSDVRKGRAFSIEHRKSLSEAQTGEKNHQFGKKLSAETRLRISKAESGAGNPFYGRRHSTESISEMSKHAHRRFGRDNHATRAVMVMGRRFESMTDAAKFAGIALSTACTRIKSPKWPDYTYAEEIK
jgi:group I intron endonuclease